MQVRATFGSGNRVVAGCVVNEGMLRKDAFLVVRRGKKVGALCLNSAVATACHYLTLPAWAVCCGGSESLGPDQVLSHTMSGADQPDLNDAATSYESPSGQNSGQRINVRAQTVFEGQLTSLRRGKDDVKEVGRGLECGLRVDGFTAWREVHIRHFSSIVSS